MQYRRAKTPGATYFFTVVTFRRRKILCEPENRELLITAFRIIKSRHPFTIDAFVLLPEHLHCIWTLPSNDSDYPMRWNGIKGHFSHNCLDKYKTPPSAVQQHKRAQTIWQPRFWEHQIRDERDYEYHCDYIHWNPAVGCGDDRNRINRERCDSLLNTSYKAAIQSSKSTEKRMTDYQRFYIPRAAGF